MSFAQSEVISVTTDGDGDATVYSSRTYTGRLVSIAYTKDDFANGVDFTITSENTGQTLWDEDDVNASKVVAPLQAAHGNDGQAAEYALGFPVEVGIHLVHDRIKIVIASGGATKSGAFRVIVA